MGKIVPDIFQCLLLTTEITAGSLPASDRQSRGTQFFLAGACFNQATVFMRAKGLVASSIFN